MYTKDIWIYDLYLFATIASLELQTLAAIAEMLSPFPLCTPLQHLIRNIIQSLHIVG